MFLQTSVYDKVSLLSIILFLVGPMSVQPYIAGAFLSPLLKKDGGIRPVACGDLFRRISSKVLAQRAKEKAKVLLFPCQLGVAVPLGAEASIHAFREVVDN